jgi:hypothetical protein
MEASAALDLEAPLVELGEKDGEPKREQADRQQQDTRSEHQQPSG